MMILDVQRTEMVRASATQDLAQKTLKFGRVHVERSECGVLHW